MGTNYYRILNVDPDADEEALRRAYKKGAMKWHPDRNRNNKEVAEKKFKEISEAYQVLSDPKKKEIYDRFGEDGLKSGMHESGVGGGASFHTHNFGGGFRSPEDLFRELFENGGGFPNSGFGGGGGGFHDASGFSSMFGGGTRRMRKQPDTEVNLNLELEDLYHGVTKKLKISKNVVNADGTMSREDKIHHVEIKPGYKAGTKIRYTGAGGEQIGYQAADVVFIVNEKPHAQFKRNRDNLEYIQKISLADALAGTVVQVKGLDDKKYQLDSTNDIIMPGTVKTIPGAGMPISKQPGKRGDMLIRFEIQFPRYLSSEKKRNIRELLS